MNDLVIPAKAAHDADVVGGKAAALNALKTAGFTVPDFFVLTTGAFRAGPSGPVAARGLKPALAAALKSLGPGPYAVRSSGRAEDGAAHSHAGQFDTVLEVPAANVLEAAKQVWESGFGATVAAYRKATTDAPAEAPAIIVQRMVPARAAGVAFSADPVAGLRGRAVISAISGLGERLVSGEVDGEDWVIGADGDALDAPDPAAVLNLDEAQAVAALARKAEATFGTPQDIEWAFAGKTLHMLQSRPITTALRSAAISDNAVTVFDNSNIVESYPGLVSPLTYSFASYVYARVYRAFVLLLGVSARDVAQNAAVFDNMLGRVDGRVYYNLGNWYRALALLPGFSLNRAYMETMMGVDEPLPAELTDSIGATPVSGWPKAREYLRVGRVGLGVFAAAAVLPRTRARFYDRLNRALAGPSTDSANLTELAQTYRRIESELLDRWDAPLINDLLCMIGFGASRGVLQKWAGDEGLAFHNALMIGQGDIVSAEPAQRIADLGRQVATVGLGSALASGGMAALKDQPQIKAGIMAYLDKFGDRCTEELKLESIPLTDDPSPLLAAVAASAARGGDARPDEVLPDWADVIDHPLKRVVARVLIGWAKARVRDRENLRFERTRVFGYARRVFLAMGRELTAIGKLEAPRDILFLTVPEVLGAIEGFGMTQDLRPVVTLRKAEAAAQAKRPEPSERLSVRGAAIGVTVAGPAVVHIAAGDVQTGTGCSAGVVTAPARVIRDPRRESLAPGEVLVARNTDPGWIAVFSNASAIVVERGSLLSHSAIVARELGIPCVVGLKQATTWIADGQTITVDGGAGQVRKHND